MSTLSMKQAGQLGGFLQLGPHYFPKRPEGAQIIMRGPHGQRLAADPVYIREHDQPRGSGFRFWSEQLNVPADVKWNPQQVVTGVMGLGAAAPSIARIAGCPPGAPPRPSFPPENVAGSRAVRAELMRAVGAACRGRIEGARQAIRGANYFMKDVPSSYRGFWASEIATAAGYIAVAEKGAAGRRAAADAADAAHGRDLERWGRDREDRCAPYDMGCLADAWLKRNWWKLAIGIGGVVVLYGAAAGAGRGFAAKRL